MVTRTGRRPARDSTSVPPWMPPNGQRCSRIWRTTDAQAIRVRRSEWPDVSAMQQWPMQRQARRASSIQLRSRPRHRRCHREHSIRRRRRSSLPTRPLGWKLEYERVHGRFVLLRPNLQRSRGPLHAHLSMPQHHGQWTGRLQFSRSHASHRKQRLHRGLSHIGRTIDRHRLGELDQLSAQRGRQRDSARRRRDRELGGRSERDGPAADDLGH